MKNFEKNLKRKLKPNTCTSKMQQQNSAPDIKNVSEVTARLLQPHDIEIELEPTTVMRRFISNSKEKCQT